MESTWAQRLVRGGLSGLAGGVASVAMLWIAVEPPLARAIALEGASEDMHSHAGSSGGHAHDSGEVVTRLQQQVGGSLTVVVVAALLGVAFAVVYGRSRHRLPGSTDLGRSLALGGLCFVALALVPAIAVPANPPGVGDPDTVNYRTLCYLLAIGLGVLMIGAAFGVRRRLASSRVSAEGAWIAVTAVLVAGVAVILMAPAPADTVPATMPAALLWDFRVGSLAQLAAMWAAVGLVHGVLVSRAVGRRRELPAAQLVDS